MTRKVWHTTDNHYQVIKEALAQTQEPVQFKCTVIDNQHPNGIPLEQWTSPPQRTWVGLTDEEIAELHHEIKVRLMGTYKTEDIYRAIEAKLKEKNHG